MRRWAKRPGANASGGVPTNRREDVRFKKEKMARDDDRSLAQWLEKMIEAEHERRAAKSCFNAAPHFTEIVARMSKATCGYRQPAYRYAHAGYARRHRCTPCRGGVLPASSPRHGDVVAEMAVVRAVMVEVDDFDTV